MHSSMLGPVLKMQLYLTWFCGQGANATATARCRHPAQAALLQRGVIETECGYVRALVAVLLPFCHDRRHASISAKACREHLHFLFYVSGPCSIMLSDLSSFTCLEQLRVHVLLSCFRRQQSTLQVSNAHCCSRPILASCMLAAWHGSATASPLCFQLMLCHQGFVVLPHAVLTQTLCTGLLKCHILCEMGMLSHVLCCLRLCQTLQLRPVQSRCVAMTANRRLLALVNKWGCMAAGCR